jgi:hypothetical protein
VVPALRPLSDGHILRCPPGAGIACGPLRAARATREAPSLFYYCGPRDVIKFSSFENAENVSESEREREREREGERERGRERIMLKVVSCSLAIS